MAEDIKKTGEHKSADSFVVPEADVHVMPKKFIIKDPKKKDSGAKGIIIFFVIFFILLLAGLAVGYYIIQQKNKPKNENQNIVENINQNTNQNSNTNLNENVNTPVNDNVDIVNNSTSTDSNENTNTNNTNNTVVSPPLAVADSDQDGLTDLEEEVYQTSAQNPDSDKDGYRDGDEVKNLYNPLASIQKLIDSGLVIRYANDYGYEIFSPKSWLVKAIDDSRQKIEFIPDNSTTELVRIEVSANTNKKSLVDWQKAMYGSEVMENFKLADKSALRSLDKKIILVVTEQYVYNIIHETGNSGVNFGATFDMMLNSLVFKEPLK